MMKALSALDPSTKPGAKPTLKDVARLAGCSPSLVSTVINGGRRTNIVASAAMQKRIRDAAQQLNYRPNYASQSLARNATRTVGIYVEPQLYGGLGFDYEGTILRGVEQASHTHGYDLLAINLSGEDSPEACGNKFAERRIDGLILIHLDHEAQWVEPLLKQSPNVVSINYYGLARLRRFNFDDQAAAALAVEHLHELGHQRIGFIGSRYERVGPGMQLRLRGFEAGLHRCGLAFDPTLSWITRDDELLLEMPSHGDPGQADEHSCADWLMSMGPRRPTALVAYNDLTAIRLIRTCIDRGLNLPRDLSIVGIDGSVIGELIRPALTTVRQPLTEMGRQATEQMILNAGHAEQQMSRKPEKYLEKLFAPELSVRGSTCRLTENK